MIIIGGIGRAAGAVAGAILLYLLPFVLSPLIGHHHALVFGLVMVLVVLFQPKGLMGLWDQWLGHRFLNGPGAQVKPSKAQQHV
jgi:branched-chain amino acid transport system permease protein